MVHNRAYLLVSHNNFLSVYDIIEKKWIYHHDFEGELLDILKIAMLQGLRIGIILKNGKFYTFSPTALTHSDIYAN